MCTVVYRAEDGKEFDNEEDCKRYTDQPSVWLVHETRSGRYFYVSKALKAFNTKYLAEEYIKHHKDIKRDDKEYIYEATRIVISNGDKYND